MYHVLYALIHSRAEQRAFDSERNGHQKISGLGEIFKGASRDLLLAE